MTKTERIGSLSTRVFPLSDLKYPALPMHRRSLSWDNSDSRRWCVNATYRENIRRRACRTGGTRTGAREPTHGVQLIRRTDNNNWAIPGGAVDLGESVAQTAVLETPPGYLNRSRRSRELGVSSVISDTPSARLASSVGPGG
jgi:hypothetical protein